MKLDTTHMHYDAIEILQKELAESEHYAQFPQDKYPADKKEIKTLNNISEYHTKRAERLEKSINYLINYDQNDL